MKDRKYDQVINDTRWWRRVIRAHKDRTARKACSAMIKLNKPVLFYGLQAGNIRSLPGTVLTVVITRGVKAGGGLCMRIVTDTGVAFVKLRSFRWTATIIIRGEWRGE